MIQVYTGDGKGKTSAALGLALRATGAGLRVYVGQFLKGNGYGECKSLRSFKTLKLEQFGRGCFIYKKSAKVDKELAKQGLEKIKKIILEQKFDVVILDEICVAVKLKLVDVDEVIHLIKSTPASIELILTGRDAPSSIIRLADLVSEIKEVKHYFRRGRKARKGVEY